MKKILLLVMMAFAITCTFSGCSKKEEPVKEQNKQLNPLVGTWANATGGWIYTFNADYTYSEIFIEESTGIRDKVSGTYAIQGDLLYFTIEVTMFVKFYFSDPCTLVIDGHEFYKLSEDY
ncbi:MAG: hypothetical protein J6J57_04570 [Alistipes sp.]|nr:hypothetical protein [Alistipes sp.]